MVAAEKIKAGKLNMYSFLNEFEVCEICKLRSEVFLTEIHVAQAKLDTPVVRENSFLTPFSTLRDMKMLDHHGGDTVLKGGDIKSITRGQLTLLQASFQCVAVLFLYYILDPRC